MNDTPDHDAITGELMTPDASSVDLVRAEIDMQIATARRFPRQKPRVIADKMMELVTMSEEAAELCIYSLPRGKKPIHGPSIRFAEALMQMWGNCRVKALTTDIDLRGQAVSAEGIFLDLESNAASSDTARRSIRDRNGRTYNNDMINVTANAARSIAKRNAILAGIPRMVWGAAYDTALQVTKGDITTLVERRGKAMEAFQRYGVSADQILKRLGLPSIEHIDPDHMVWLKSTFAAIKAGDMSVEQAFAEDRVGVAHEIVKDPLGHDDEEDSRKADAAVASTPVAGTEAATGAPLNGAASDNKPADAGPTEAKTAAPAQQQGQDGDKPAAAQSAAAGPEPATAPPAVTATGPTAEELAARLEERKAAARAAAARNFENGMSRRVIPAEYRDPEEVRAAYLDAYDDEADASKRKD